nr:MAG TPA: hypothetical protein [Bacteriophage sp.]
MNKAVFNIAILLVTGAVCNIISGYYTNLITDHIREQNADIFNDNASGQTVDI